MNLKAKSLAGVRYTTVSTIFITILQFAKLAILARLLTPGDFGLMAIVTVIIGFAQAFADMGISNAIIHRQDITRSQLSSLYWLNVASGVVLTVVTFILASLLTEFYVEPRLEDLVNLVAPLFIITAIGNQFRILLQKEMQFDHIAKINVLSEILATGVAIVMAWYGYGVLALVYSMLVAASINSLLFLWVGLTQYPRPTFSYHHHELSGIYSFGLYQMGERSINYFSANIDKLLIGKILGMEVVGLYNMAWQLIIFPLSKINPIINAVAFPAYAKLQHDNVNLARYYTLSLMLLSLITVPLLAFLYFFADVVVNVVFGAGWEQTVILVKILAVVGISKAIGNPGGALLLGKGRADIGFWWNLLWATAITCAMAVALRLWPRVESAAYTLLELSLTVGLIWHILLARLARINYRPIVLHLTKVAGASFLCGWVSLYGVTLLGTNSAILQLGMGGILYGTFYIIYILLFESSLIMTVMRK